MATADGIAGIGAPSTSTRLLEAVWPVEAAPFAALGPCCVASAAATVTRC